MSDKVILSGTITEKVDLGGDTNLKIENGGQEFWITQSKLDKFTQMGLENSISFEVPDLEVVEVKPKAKSKSRPKK